MIIFYKTTPSSFLKAAMLSRLHKGYCIPWDDQYKTLLTEEFIDCDTLKLKAVQARYEAKFGQLPWLGGQQSRNLAAGTFYASRSRADEVLKLIVVVMGQALEYGPDYVLGRVSRESKKMLSLSRQVCMEIQRAHGFIRLTPVTVGSQHYMVGKAEFQNQIADLVLRHFAHREKNSIVYIIAGNQAFHLNGQTVMATDLSCLPFTLPKDEFAQFWEAYYDSQYIENRKNLVLAQKHLPKKYWSWVTEGQKLSLPVSVARARP